MAMIYHQKHKNIQLFLANIQQIDLIMEFKAKIKSMTQYPIRGTRLFPTQILTSDSNKSIHIPEELANNSFSRLNNSNHVNIEPPTPEIVRVSNRHTTEVAGNRPAINRLSLDQAIKNRSIGEAESSLGTSSGRYRNQQAITQPNSLQQEQLTYSQIVGKEHNNHNSAFKELHIQKIVSTQTRQQIKMAESLASTPFKLGKEEIKELGDSRSGQESGARLQEGMYLEYKNKYEALEKDHKRMIEKFKDSQRSYEVKVAKLEDSLKNTRSINESLMKKEREVWKKVKSLEDENEKLKVENSDALKVSLEVERARYEEEIRIINKDLFELKLKLIDQTNSHEQSSRAKETALFQLEKVNNLLRDEIDQLRSQNMGFLKQELSLSAQIENKEKQIAQQKEAIQRQLSFKAELIYTNSLFQTQLAKMGEMLAENAMINHQLLGIEELQTQNNGLKEQISLQNEDILRMREQIIRIDGQGLRLDQQNLRLNTQLQCIASMYNEQIATLNYRRCQLQAEREELIETLEDKESVIAQLNLARSNALLDVLDLKNQLKKREEEETAKKQQKKTEAQKDQTKVSQLQSMLDTVNERVSSLQKEKAQLETTLASKQQKLAEAEVMQSHLFIQIYDLQQILYTKTTEVAELQETLLTLKGEKEYQVADKDREIQGLMSSKIQLKIENLQSSQKSQNEINKLNRVIEELQKDKESLMISNIQLEEEARLLTEQIQRLFQEQMRQKINKEANSELMKQKEQQISSRANQLKEVEQQYLQLIEGELKKIQYMNGDEEDEEFQLQDRVDPTCLSFSRNQSPASSHHTSPKKNPQVDSNSSQEQEDVLQLTLKIEQLAFVNEALRRKVEELTELQENSNIIILDKIKLFQQNLQKSLLEKGQVERYNGELINRVKELTDKCIAYQCKIEWLDGMYKELESNLSETQEDLLISHMKFINFKLMRDGQSEDEEVISRCNIRLDVNSCNAGQEKSDTHQISVQQSSVEENKSKSASRSLREQVDEDLSCESCQSMEEQPLSEDTMREIQQNRELILKIFNQELPDEDFVGMSNEQVEIEEAIVKTQTLDLVPWLTQQNNEVKINIFAVQSQDSAGQQLNTPLINIIQVKSQPPSDQQEIIEPLPQEGIQINVIAVHSQDQYSDNQQFLEEIDHYLAEQQKMGREEDEEQIYFDCADDNESEMMVESTPKVQQKKEESGTSSFDYLIGLIEKTCKKVEEQEKEGNLQDGE